MKYSKVEKAKFINRPNRFIANVVLNGNKETVHIKNTGRCKELLVPDCTVYLSKSDNENRKTKYDLIAVEKQRINHSPILINMDSQIPNDVIAEWLLKSNFFGNDIKFRREVAYSNSRFDFLIEGAKKQIFTEVKGVTLENNGVALFPDAPTLRGVKHINELCMALDNGYEAYILFVIQMKGVHTFKPNIETHPEFATALKNAVNKGVKTIAMDCKVTPDSILIDSPVNIKLD